MIIDNKYTIPHTIMFSRMDGKGRLPALSFVSTAQDLAANHYSSGGLSVPHLQKMGFTWIIAKQHFVFHNYPLGGDRLILQTWARQPKGLFCFRDYQYSYSVNGKKSCLQVAIADEIANEGQNVDLTVKKENIILSASSSWMILDLKKERPVKISAETMGNLGFCEDKALETSFSKIPLSDDWDIQTEFSPSLLDIDINSHVNHPNYVHRILSYMDYDFCKNKLMQSLETYFISSALFGDKLICRCKTLDDVCLHSIIRADGTEVFRARTVWKPEEMLSRKLKIDSDD